MKVMHILLLAAGFTVSPVAGAGDKAAGEKLVQEKQCSACHQRLVGGDGSQIYLRSDRRVTTLPKLHAQVTFCSTQLKTGWFPEDEDDVVAWLNHRYYHFP